MSKKSLLMICLLIVLLLSCSHTTDHGAVPTPTPQSYPTITPPDVWEINPNHGDNGVFIHKGDFTTLLFNRQKNLFINCQLTNDNVKRIYVVNPIEGEVSRPEVVVIKMENNGALIQIEETLSFKVYFVDSPDQIYPGVFAKITVETVR